jgi:histidinol-phosphate aminotransferase
MILKDIVSNEVFQQNGYIAPELTGSIKMDANENPLGLKETLKKKLLEQLSKVELNRYPQAGALDLRDGFARYYGIDKDMIMLGNGSDELIQLLCIALKGKINGILVPLPTFVMYKIIGINTGNRVVEVPLTADYDLDMDAMLNKIEQYFPALIYLSYPNSPTGNCFGRNNIEELLQKTPGIVVVDEAYASFSGDSFLPLLKKYSNLVVLKTLSKLGLAAIRLGFLIGNRELIAQLDKVRLPYNVNSLSHVAAGFFLDYQDEFALQVKEIVKQREELYQGLQEIAGIKPYPSRANFIFFSCSFASDRIYKSLAAKGILIKNLHNPPLISNCMRVTVGNLKENKAFLSALKAVVSEQGA